MTKPITSVGVGAPTLEELMESATETREPVRIESRDAVGPTVDRALLAFDRSQALASSVRLFALRPIPGASEPVPEGDPIEERPIGPLSTEEPMATGGTGDADARPETLTINGHAYPISDTPREGYELLQLNGHPGFWVRSEDVTSIRRDLGRTDGAVAIGITYGSS